MAILATFASSGTSSLDRNQSEVRIRSMVRADGAPFRTMERFFNGSKRAQAPSQARKSIRIDERSRVAKQHDDRTAFPGKNPGLAARFRGPVVGLQCPGVAGGARPGLPRRVGVQLESDARVPRDVDLRLRTVLSAAGDQALRRRATSSPPSAPGSSRRALRKPGPAHKPTVSGMRPAASGVV